MRVFNESEMGDQKTLKRNIGYCHPTKPAYNGPVLLVLGPGPSSLRHSLAVLIGSGVLLQ